MQKGHRLQFNCTECQHPVRFSLFELESHASPTRCPECDKGYVLDDPVLQRQLRKFESLCRQIVESAEILGDTAIGINVGDRHIKIPYKLLLTRFNSSLDLVIDDQPLSITFRMEPEKDLLDSQS